MNRYRVTWVETWGEVASAVVEATDMVSAVSNGYSPPDVPRSIVVTSGSVNGAPVVKVELLLETDEERP